MTQPVALEQGAMHGHAIDSTRAGWAGCHMSRGGLGGGRTFGVMAASPAGWEHGLVQPGPTTGGPLTRSSRLLLLLPSTSTSSSSLDSPRPRPATMSSHRQAVRNDQEYTDPNPLPKEVPQVDELGTTSAPLKSASFFIGDYCKEYNGKCPPEPATMAGCMPRERDCAGCREGRVDIARGGSWCDRDMGVAVANSTPNRFQAALELWEQSLTWGHDCASSQRCRAHRGQPARFGGRLLVSGPIEERHELLESGDHPGAGSEGQTETSTLMGPSRSGVSTFQCCWLGKPSAFAGRLHRLASPQPLCPHSAVVHGPS